MLRALIGEMAAPIRQAAFMGMDDAKQLFGVGGSLTHRFKAYQLVARHQIARETHRFKFALESADTLLGLPVGHHVHVRLSQPGPGSSNEVREYTPITGNETKGSFELVVKFVKGGKFSRYFASLQVGDKVEVAGPMGMLTYNGNGRFHMQDTFGSSKTLQCRNVLMVSGGSGVTPMYQIASHLTSTNDPLRLSLLSASKLPHDAILHEELNSLAQRNEAFSVLYSVDKDGYKPSFGNRFTGLLTADMLSASLEPLSPQPDLVCTCGPAAFQQHVRGILTDDLSICDDSIFEFETNA